MRSVWMSIDDDIGPARAMIANRHPRFILLVILVVGGSLLVPLAFLPNWDVAWYFEMSQRLLDGERLYEGTVEVNFPLAVYIYLPAVWLSNLAGGGPYFWLAGGLAAISLLILAISERELLDSSDHGSGRWWMLQAGLALTLVVFPTFKFGQREHLAVLLTLPYLLYRLSERSRSDNGELSHLVPLSLIAGIGFSLKPFFVIPWFITQIVVTRGNWNRRNLGLVALTALPMGVQFLSIPVFYPDLLRLYGIFGREYQAFGHVDPAMIILENLYLPATAFVFLAAARLVDPTRRVFVAGLAWTSIAWFLTGVIQTKGWSYHFLPAHLTLILSGFIAALSVSRSGRRVAVQSLIGLCVILIAVAGIWRERARVDYPSRRARLPADLRAVPSGLRSLSLSVRMDTSYPLLNELDARHVGSFPILWPLEVEYAHSGQPGRVVPVRPLNDINQPESVLFESVVRDLVEKKPDLILVTTGNDPAFNDGQFDYLGYFSRDMSFKRELDNYSPGPSLEHIQFYVRKREGN